MNTLHIVLLYNKIAVLPRVIFTTEGEKETINDESAHKNFVIELWSGLHKHIRSCQNPIAGKLDRMCETRYYHSAPGIRLHYIMVS